MLLASACRLLGSVAGPSGFGHHTPDNPAIANAFLGKRYRKAESAPGEDLELSCLVPPKIVLALRTIHARDAHLSGQKWEWMSNQDVAPLAALFNEAAVLVHLGATMSKTKNST